MIGANIGTMKRVIFRKTIEQKPIYEQVEEGLDGTDNTTSSSNSNSNNSNHNKNNNNNNNNPVDGKYNNNFYCKLTEISLFIHSVRNSITGAYTGN